MKPKEYEMPEDYNRDLSVLLEAIADRDKLIVAIKTTPPKHREEGLRILRQMNQSIEKSEAALADYYEKHQTMRRAEAKREALFEKIKRQVAGSYIHVKYNHPETEEQIRKYAANLFDSEEDFNALVAHLEATELEKIIARAPDAPPLPASAEEHKAALIAAHQTNFAEVNTPAPLRKKRKPRHSKRK